MLPQNLKRIIEKDEHVKSVTIDANKRSRVSALIEPTEEYSGLDREEFLELIWPAILESNSNAPHYGQLSKKLIVFTKKEKPVALSVKGTRSRGKTLLVYKEELDALYV